MEIFTHKYTYDGQTEDGNLSFSSEGGGEKILTKSELIAFAPYLLDYLDYFEGLLLFSLYPFNFVHI